MIFPIKFPFQHEFPRFFPEFSGFSPPKMATSGLRPAAAAQSDASGVGLRAPLCQGESGGGAARSTGCLALSWHRPRGLLGAMDAMYIYIY